MITLGIDFERHASIQVSIPFADWTDVLGNDIRRRVRRPRNGRKSTCFAGHNGGYVLVMNE